MIDPRRWNVGALGAAWRAAEPFPYVVIDDLVEPATLELLRAGITAEPHFRDGGELADFMASAPELHNATLRAFQASFSDESMLAAVGNLAGKRLERCDMRSYVYLPGHYLLPHSDHQATIGRQVAFAYYLTMPEGCVGGQLDLFACSVEEGQIVATRPAHSIEQRANRLVLFDVSEVSLHQVREVVSGARVSLAGWFL